MWHARVYVERKLTFANVHLAPTPRTHLPNDSYKNGSKPKGTINLDAYFVGKSEANATEFEFTVHAYPKNMTCRATGQDDMQGWIDELLKPLA